MALFELDWDMDFRGLTFPEVIEGREASIYGVMELIARQFHGTDSIAHNWSPLRLVYNDEDQDLPIGDFPWFYGYFPVFTWRSLQVLRDLLVKHGELLPLESPDGVFTAYKVLTHIDAIDRDRSEAEYFPKTEAEKRRHAGPPLLYRLRRGVFLEDKIGDTPIFKLANSLQETIYVSSEFVDRVVEAGLRGFAFNQVWPPPDSRAERERFLQKRMKKKGRNNPGGQGKCQ